MKGRPLPAAAAAGVVDFVFAVVLTAAGVVDELAPVPLPLGVFRSWTWFRLMTFSFLAVALSICTSSSSDEDPGTF